MSAHFSQVARINSTGIHLRPIAEPAQDVGRLPDIGPGDGGGFSNYLFLK